MKVTKSQLKELIKHAIVEDIMDKEIKNPKTGNKIKVRTALQLPDEHPANKKAKEMVAKSGVEKDDVGGPAYPNVKKGVKTSKQAKGVFDKPKKDIGKTPQPSDFDGDMDKYLDALNQHMKDVEAKLDKDKPKYDTNSVEGIVTKQNDKVATQLNPNVSSGEELVMRGMADDIDEFMNEIPDEGQDFDEADELINFIRDNEQGMRDDDDDMIDDYKERILKILNKVEFDKEKETGDNLKQMDMDDEDTMQQSFYKISYTDSEGREKTDSMRAKTPEEAKKDFINMNKGRGFKVVNVQKESVNESKKKRFTVKEVRMWMKKLEENRYKKVYNSDARRVAWMVNNEGRTLDEMPISMKKKWSKAQYGRERYLATEFLKSKSEQMNEGKLTSEQLSEGFDLKKLEIVIKSIQKKIAKQGRVTNARDEDHLKQLIKVYKQMGGKKIKEQMNESKLRGMIREIIKEQLNEKINLGGAYEKMIQQTYDGAAKNAFRMVTQKVANKYKVGKPSPVEKGTKVTKRLVSTMIGNSMKELRNKAKSPGLKKAFQKLIDKIDKDTQKYKKLGERKIKEAYRSQSIFFDKKDKSKLEKLLKKNKGKFPFNPSGESVVNWSLNDRGSKGLEWGGIPKAKYNKAVEFFMKNKLNPRG